MTKDRKRLALTFTAVGLATVILDQVSKVWALRSLSDGQYRPLIGEYLGLKLIHNPGAAFSFAENQTWIFTVFAAFICVAIPFAMRKINSRLLTVALALMWGGALGNLIDRLTQPPGFPGGHVVDFIKYGDWFVGNIADIAIVVAAAVLAIWALSSDSGEASQQ